MLTMLMGLLGAAVESQIPPPIPAHDHAMGPVPSKIIQSAEVVCPAGALRVTATQSPRAAPSGVYVSSIALNGVELGSDALRNVRMAAGRLTALHHVEAGCFSEDTFVASVSGATAEASGSVKFLVAKGQITITP